MILEEYTLENTKIKFYDDYIVENIVTQKEYIDNIISGYTNATNTLLRMVVNLLNQNGKINLIKGKDFSFLS